MDPKAEIERRLEELKAQRKTQEEDLRRQVEQMMAPIDASILELENLLALWNENHTPTKRRRARKTPVALD